MRLRPSGRQGPVATSLTAFESYQRDEAWTWEHLALTRARVIAGDPGLGEQVEQFRISLLAEKSAGAAIGADVAEMRARIAAARPGEGGWDAKIGPGRLQDLELTAQMLALQTGSAARDTAGQIAAGVAMGLLNAAEGGALQAAAGLFWHMQAAARLLAGGVLSPDDIGEGGRRFVLRETGQGSVAQLQAAMDEQAQAAQKVIDGLVSAKGER